MAVLTSILEVFSALGEWLVETVLSLVPMFYVAETGLTFLGILAVCGVGVGLILLLVSIIQNFLSFRS